MNDKRKKVEEKILDVIQTMDPSGTNRDKYKELFSSMSDNKFDEFMRNIRSGKDKLKIFTPNMKISLKQENLLKAGDKVNINFFERIKLKDHTTGKMYTTPLQYMILKLPIRRAKQFLMHKLSVPESDKRIDNITGQVMKPDRSSGMSFVEAQLLYSRGLTNTITEMLKVRGGDVQSFTSYKQQLEETGDYDLNSIDPNSVTRSTVVASAILKCMYFDNNLVE